MVINDLDALEAACTPESGLEFIRGQQTFKWWGRHVGDYPLPKGFTAADMGHCEHAIRVRGNAGAYEVGVVQARDGSNGYILMYDFYGGGQGLMKVVGKDCGDLMMHYGVEMTKRKLRRMGVTNVKKSTDAKTGEILLTYEA